MDDIYEFNSSEWGEIVYEESTNNRRLRAGPSKRMGFLAIAEGAIDILLALLLFYLSLNGGPLSDLSGNSILLVVLMVVLFGVGMFAVGAYRLSLKVKPISLLEKGIVEGNFTPYEEMPVIELKGPKGKGLFLTRSGKVPISTDPKVLKEKKGFVRVIQTPDEYDFMQFTETLKKSGYGGNEGTTAEGPTDGSKTLPPTDDKKDGGDAKPSDEKKDGPKDEAKPANEKKDDPKE